MKKLLKRTLFLWVALLMLGVPVLVASAATPTLTFTNEKDDTLSLSVTKEVYTNSGEAIPEEDEFTFTILLKDGESYVVDSKLTYTLYDSEDNEWVNVLYADATDYELVKKTEIDSSKQYTLGTFAPDSEGKFTLKAGWKAVFTSSKMRSGSFYKVTEETDGNGYVTFGAGENSYYYVPDKEEISEEIQTNSQENLIAFKNKYIPPDTESKTCDLQISKDIVEMDGYSLPEAPTFTYRLQISGSDYANKSYDVYDSTFKEKVSSGTTNDKGEFTIEGGQYAQFNDIKTNLEYTVYEYAKSGWWYVGKTSDNTDGAYAAVRTDVTKSYTEEAFQNRCASFFVRKEVTNQDSSNNNTSFRFVLKKENGDTWANQSYYLYDVSNSENKVLIGNGAQKTASDGSFYLEANQEAMFVGIEPGTVYTVEEASSPLYECVSPDDGTDTRTVSEKDAESLVFENSIIESKGLYVSKLAINEPTSTTDTEYTFKLVSVTKNDSGEEVETAITSKAVDSDGKTIDIEEDGTFKLKSGDYAHFTKLEDGNYRVYEIGIDKEVIVSAIYTDSNTESTNMTVELDDEATTRTAMLKDTFSVSADKSQELAVTNTYTEAMFRISKTILDYKGNTLGEDGSGSENSQIESGGDLSQRFVYRIDKYENKAAWTSGEYPVSTTYTDFSCDKTGNGSILVQGSGSGWYVITELDTWSNTDYDYKSDDYQGLYKNATNAANYYVEGKKENEKYIAFDLEEVYDAYELPTAHFVNEESPYAYRSGQAYADNKIG